MNKIVSHPFLLLFAAALLYTILSTIVPYGVYILYPFIISSVIFHEFGHALGAVITDGTVHNLQINANTSGVTTTSGGIMSIILMGGYIGSIIFGNIFLSVGYIVSKVFASVFLKLVAVIFFICSFFWFSNLTSFIITIVFSLVMYYASELRYNKLIIMAIGALMICHIIYDFNVGPMSDLNKFNQLWPILSTKGWSAVWLFIAMLITYFNMRFLTAHYKKKYMIQMDGNKTPNVRDYE